MNISQIKRGPGSHYPLSPHASARRSRLPGGLIVLLSNLLLFVACVATFLMALHIMADVAGKFLFNAPIRGTLEVVSFYYMVIGVFFPLAYISRRRAHIVVELFTNWLSKRGLAMLNGIVGLVTCAFMTVFAWKTVEEAIRRTAMGEVWQTGYESMLLWPSRWILAIGCATMALCAILGALDDFRSARKTPAAGDADAASQTKAPIA